MADSYVTAATATIAERATTIIGISILVGMRPELTERKRRPEARRQLLAFPTPHTRRF
jgi:hypothetical protein